VWEGLPLESSPSTEEEEDDDDDDDEGMEVRVVFRPEVGFSSAPASTGPSDGASPPAQGLAASLSGALASAQLAPIPTKAEEAEVVKGETVLLPVEAVVVPAGAPVGSPQRPPARVNTEEGLSLPPCFRPGARSGLSYCHTRVLGAPRPRREIITKCARNKSDTYDDSWYRNECHNINI
jgi:hypothetical protein